MSARVDNETGLDALEKRLAEDLSLLELPAKPWVPARMHDGAPVRDVVVIGAGMCGLAATAKLVLSGINNVVAYDAAPAGLEGPWATFARMETLRSPKSLHGPALGLPQLTFRAWFTAQWGSDAWASLDKIPKNQWMDYLIWYRRVLALPVQNGVRMTAIAPAGDLIALDLEGAQWFTAQWGADAWASLDKIPKHQWMDYLIWYRRVLALPVQNGVRMTAIVPAGDLIALDLEGAQTGRVYTRHLVLATGRSGLGGFAVPDFLKGVDSGYWAHSADDIDFTALKGKRLAVIGAGASSMDNAATALESGAESLDLLIRRKEMPRINKMTGIGSQGVVHGMHQLPDAWKWKFVDYTATTQTPPPRGSTLRVSRHANARFLLDCGINSVQEDAGELLIDTTQGLLRYDFLIAATGFSNDFSGRPEFTSLAPHIRRWAAAQFDSARVSPCQCPLPA